MENLKIFSFDFGSNSFSLPNSSNTKVLKTVTDFIKKENFDIALLQGNENLLYNLCIKANLGQYEIIDSYAIFSRMVRTVFLFKQTLPCLSNYDGKMCSVFISQLGREPIAFFNVKKNKKDDLEEFKTLYSLYSNSDNDEYVKSRIVSGTFNNVDIKKLCTDCDLVDISSSVVSNYRGKKGSIDYILISKNLVANEVRKRLDVVDNMKFSSHCPIEASVTYKKVLK